MIVNCPGSQSFSQPHPEFIKCTFCGREIEIWSDETKSKCQHCGKLVFRGQNNTCLDWCAEAKTCVGEGVYKKYLKGRKQTFQMGYEAALSKAWDELSRIAEKKAYKENFLREIYEIDVDKKEILSVSSKTPAKPYLAILILHYLLKKLKDGLPPLGNTWISFKELTGGEGYYPAFKKRVIDTIARKFGPQPEELFKLKERFGAKKTDCADASVILETFKNVPLLIELWRACDEFGPAANVLFDKSILDIFCTEDITVLSEIAAHSI